MTLSCYADGDTGKVPVLVLIPVIVDVWTYGMFVNCGLWFALPTTSSVIRNATKFELHISSLPA